MHNVTAKEFLNYPENRIFQRTENIKLLEELLVSFGQLKCKEQRQICSENADADYNFVGIRDEDSHIEVYVLKRSILNSPEPKM